MSKKIFFLLIIFILLPATSFAAQTYNPNNIISDNDYLDSNSMSSGYVQDFLNSKGSGLASTRINVSGTLKSVADIFFEASVKYNVSQKLLLATAQKEQSALTCENLTQNQLNKLMGYGIYSGNDYSEYLGAYNQINYAARQFRRYYDNHERYGWQKDQTRTTSDKVVVTPKTKATAGLYNYTPYAGAREGTTLDGDGNGGNFLFWQVWQKWFQTRHPSGTLIQEDEKAGIYYIQDGKKKPFWSKKVFSQSFQEKDIIKVSKNEADAYSTVSAMKFPNGTLIQSPTGGVYVIENGQKMAITSKETFNSLGYKKENIIQVKIEELNLYPEGGKITSETILYPNGTLVKSPINGGIYLLENNQKRPIKSRQILESQFKWSNIILISKEKFSLYEEGNPVLFKDGTLIKDEAGNIFVIENGLRRHIARPSVFAGLRYNKNNVISVPNWVVLMHPGGEAIKSY